MKELVTVVVPVYNVEKYLERCVDSIINQTYKKLEIILVDDGSTDSSSDLCDKLSKKDDRIKVIHKKNGGLSDARNVGIEIANGKYISFIDSDDWFPIDSIEIMYDYIKKYNCDIAIGALKETNSKKIKKQEDKDFSYQLFNADGALENMLYLHGITNSACGKLYKIELFDNVRYPVGKLYEDLGTTYKLFANSSKSIFLDKTVYYYYQNHASIMHRKYTKRRLEGIFFSEEICKFIEEKFPNIIDAAFFRLYYECLLVLNDMPLTSKDKKYVKRIMAKYRKEVLNDKNLYRKQKLLCKLSIFGHLPIKITFFVKGILKHMRGGI